MNVWVQKFPHALPVTLGRCCDDIVYPIFSALHRSPGVARNRSHSSTLLTEKTAPCGSARTACLAISVL
jgi:hypothetical protein